MTDGLEDLLAEFFERRERDGEVDPAAFVRAHPEVPGLDAALRAALGTDALLPARALPERIGPYDVLGELGRGGTGRVLRVSDPRAAGAVFALKLLAPAMVGARAHERFRREIAALQRLRHPAVITVRDHGEHDGTPYFVMDLVEGESLAARVARARAGDATGPRADRLALPGDGRGACRAAALVARIARGVQAMHDAGLLHRDLKPGNVLVRAADGAPVLIDLGLAGDDLAATLTASGDVLGTPAFMAPEQARGVPADARTDVYGLAAILYELLTLEVPHAGSDPTQVMLAVQTRPVRDVRRIDATVPAALAGAVRRAMSFRPARRYASAAEFADLLEALAAGRGAPRASVSLGARIEDFWRVHRRVAWLAGIVVALALATVAASAWRNASRRDTARMLAVDVATAHIAGTVPRARELAAVLCEFDPDARLGRYVLGEALDDPYFAALGEGQRRLAAGNARAALTLFQAAVEQRRSEPLGIALLGLAAAAAGDLELATRELTVAARLLPRSTRLLVRLADVHHRRRDEVEAVAAMRVAVEIDPDDAALWRDLARMQNYAKRYEEGLVSIDRALQLAGTAQPVDYLRVKGVMLDGLRRLDEAIDVMRMVVARAPGAESWISLGVSLDRAHRLDEAAAAYQAAVGLDARNARAHTSLAFLHAGSDRANCAQCRAVFERRPELFDPAKVEASALAALALDAPAYGMAETLAAAIARAGPGVAFRAEIARLLRADLPDAALGRLLKAQRILETK